VEESTPIMLYLDEIYPNSPLLFPNQNLKQQTIDWCIKLDSSLGLAARRLVYGRVLSENPAQLLQVLSVSKYNPIMEKIMGNIVAVSLMQRYAVHRNREEGIFELTYSTLEEVNNSMRDYLIGSEFSAADITLYSFLRPLRSVPFFSENPKNKTLFDKLKKAIAEHNLEEYALYEIMIEKEKNMKKSLLSLLFSIPFWICCWIGRWTFVDRKTTPKLNSIRGKTNESHADNDQQKILFPFGLWGWYVWYLYCFRLVPGNEPPPELVKKSQGIN